MEWENVNPVEAMLGENGLVSKYGAELARDWYDVFLVRRVGNDTDVSIREKKNLTGISYDVDETDVVTRIMPTGEDADGNILYLPELYIDSPNLNAYTHPKWIHLPVSEAKEVTDGDEPKSKAQCYAEMRKAAQDGVCQGMRSAYDHIEGGFRELLGCGGVQAVRRAYRHLPGRLRCAWLPGASAWKCPCA